MRSHTDVRPAYALPRRDALRRGGLHVVTTAVVLVVAVSVGAAQAQEFAQPQAERPSEAEITRALDIVKADPNLATERTIKTLRWKASTDPNPKPSSMPTGLAWIADLFGWLQQSARLLVWGAAVGLAALLVVTIVRMVRTRGASHGEAPFIAPTHVRDLDIRPESLPGNIGAAARALWDRGEHRASLALLYRGMLSRLAHVHRIPIRDSSTEGDCLALAASHLTLGRCEYAYRLVREWQRFVYGGQDIQASTVYVLCDDFAPTLDAPPFASMTSGGAA